MPSNTVSTLKRKTHIDSNGTKEVVTVSRRQGNRILEVIDKQAKEYAGKGDDMPRIWKWLPSTTEKNCIQEAKESRGDSVT
jgi:hypothetical protein